MMQRKFRIFFFLIFISPRTNRFCFISTTPRKKGGEIMTETKISSYKNKFDQQQNQLKTKAVTFKQFNIVALLVTQCNTTLAWDVLCISMFISCSYQNKDIVITKNVPAVQNITFSVSYAVQIR